MKMRISREALRRKIEREPDLEVEVGFPLPIAEALAMFIPRSEAAQPSPAAPELSIAFSTLIRLLRRKNGLDIADLARKADVAEEELLSIEHERSYAPRPRTVVQLASYFALPPRELMKLSGATVSVDTEFREAATRFAASSDDLSQLSKRESQALNEYVKYLSSLHGEREQ